MALFSSNSAWALLPIQHWTEPNGAKVYLVESPVIPMVDVQIDFDAGTRRDPAGQSGLANAVAAMASKGVKAGRDASAEPALDENGLGEAWADLGASFEANVDNDTLHYVLRSLTDPPLLERAARLAARQIAEPMTTEDVWLRDRARWSASLKEANTRPATVANHAFAAAVYGSHPYGVRTTEETLARISVADMQGFHAQYVAACRAKVSIVGAVSRAQAQTLVATLLSRLPATAGCAPLPPVGEVAALTAPAEKAIPFASAQ
ncbi:M16 family metallopeptidase, partial [Acidovorax sp. HMWF018]|uniref:M16 family metallopeptidase n=1 Tax=Acidovorax sp. HMWF018 TaxID=2056855 RepID=UPI0035139209